ncbi:MAG: tRNA (N(6)-L-threonylcarbamoyladenosine(37)-C(2))-methylthiotransferase MtaB [Rhodospirillaceae bacterium]|nr:tRNA (N(6)-L-threonylcarbamoyladenosine(37)-C(2))-methylthiotransferase MtaB [Rhodospirillaceae bacterium]
MNSLPDPIKKQTNDCGPKIITLGCRLNTLESEVMREQLIQAGNPNAVVINTCAVTAEAERQARQTIRRLRRENPDTKIIVTGCAAQLNPERFAEMVEVDRVVGNEEKLSAHTLWGNGTNDESSICVSDISLLRETSGHLVSGLEGRARAFVMIQQGCDNTCTFCIIPTARGHNRAVKANDIVTQVKKIVREGYNEVVLTGVDIAAYGDDLSDDLALSDIITMVLDGVPDLLRLRLSSLDPARIDEKLINLFATEPRLMPHVHLSLQAMDALVLKRMKRRHTPQMVLATVKKLRDARPEIAIGADLIAGFPTETDEMAENTRDGILQMGLDYFHVFPYSPRPGTPAEKMPQIGGEIIKQRAKKLRMSGDGQLQKRLHSLIGKTISVLVEKPDSARSECFALVKLNTPQSPGTIIDAEIDGVIDGQLYGRVVV